ncbi:MAG: flavodoxin domain-containing protein [Halobacteriota archaeon]
MKVLIIYDTRYGTTREIAQWLAEGLAADCDVKTVDEVANLDYDLIIVGSPMYTDEPLPSVVQFLHDHNSILSRKKVALFLVYDRLVASKLDTYEHIIREQAPPNVLEVGIFGGYVDVEKLTKHDRRTIEDFFRRLGRRYEVVDNRNKDEVLRFAQRLNDGWRKTESITKG